MTEAISLTILNLKEEECYKNLQIILPLNLIVSLFFTPKIPTYQQLIWKMMLPLLTWTLLRVNFSQQTPLKITLKMLLQQMLLTKTPLLFLVTKVTTMVVMSPQKPKTLESLSGYGQSQLFLVLYSSQPSVVQLPVKWPNLVNILIFPECLILDNDRDILLYFKIFQNLLFINFLIFLI